MEAIRQRRAKLAVLQQWKTVMGSIKAALMNVANKVLAACEKHKMPDVDVEVGGPLKVSLNAEKAVNGEWRPWAAWRQRCVEGPGGGRGPRAPEGVGGGGT